MAQNKPEPQKSNSSLHKIRAITFGIALALIILSIASYFGYSSLYSKKIYPNITIANVEVGGLEIEDAKKVLSYKIDSEKNKNINFSYEDKNWTLEPKSYDISYDLDTTVKSAYDIGRNSSIFKNFSDKLSLIFSSVNLKVAFSYNQDKLTSLFSDIDKEITTEAKNADCRIENGKVVITAEQIGKELDLKQLKNNFVNVTSNLVEDRLVRLPVNTIKPELNADLWQIAKNQGETVLGQELVLNYENKNITISKDKISSWIEFAAYEKKDNLVGKVIINQERIKAYVKSIASQINQEAKDAKLSISSGKVSAFQLSQNGYTLNQDQTVSLITDSLVGKIAGVSTDETTSSLSSTLTLPVDTKKPEISSDNIENLGIKELVGSATTTYAKSPNNRKHNIKVGAEKFQGVIIKPGEEFSFLKALGRVTTEQGFLSELVIKEDHTEPEVGGGLCQVSTTMFRAALSTGLPITERTNHKYRVSYYEPPVGLDATVYEPSPDLKFKNDTQNYILVQTSTTDNSVTFEFYGTKDGRVATVSDPETYDAVEPGPTKYIDDTSLAEGEEIYVEKAHAGIKAKVNYTVKKGDQVINQQTFYSKYVAWPAVIKRNPNTQPAEENNQQ